MIKKNNMIGNAAMMAAVAAMALSSCATNKTASDKAAAVGGTAIDDDATYLILSDAQRGAVERTNKFALDLFRTQAGMDSRVVSPVSVAYLMGMLANGAAGQTQTEIMGALNLDASSLQTLNEAYKAIGNTASRLDPQTSINIANCIALNKTVSLKGDYASAMRSMYDANVEAMDFASPKAVGKINGWCAKQTNGMIPKIVDGLDPAATAVLMNAVYFNGTWTDKFDKRETRTENFRGYTRDIKKVAMMHQCRELHYTDNADFAAVSLPYGNGSYSMTVILPAEGKSTADVMASLDARRFAGMERDMSNARRCLVDLKLPRFSTTTETQLNKPVSDLGAPSMFIPNKADFSNMSATPMFVSAMLQKAKIEVSEEGTKAAAVTAAIMTMSALNPEEPRRVSFHADRPFIYVITERHSGAIFFIGQYTGDAE